MSENYNVLVVDDNPQNLSVIGTYLDGTDYDYTMAFSGEDALNAIVLEKYDAILLDIMMPGIDGYETCKTIRSGNVTSSIPIIFTTAKTDSDSIERGFRVGGNDYITKPINNKRILLARLDAHIAQYHKYLNEHELAMDREKRMMESEKMALIGRLTGDIIYELNNPLSIIKSSNENNSKAIESIMKYFDVPKRMSEEELNKLKLISKRILSGNYRSVIDSKEDRKKIRRIMEDLSEFENLGNPRDVAMIIVRLDIEDNYRTHMDYFDSENASDIIKIIESIFQLHIGVKHGEFAVERVSKVIDSLKIYLQDSSLEKKCVNVKASIKTVLELYYSKYGENYILDLNLPVEHSIWAIEDQMIHVWSHLIDNAIDAIDVGGKISIESNVIDEEYVEIKFTDNGKGMNPDIKKQIFNPFFSTKPANKATGLGLDIVKKIIKNNNGEIDVESTEFVGTTFTIKLKRDI